MEFIEGEIWVHYRRRLSTAGKAGTEYHDQVCDALDEAHAAKVIHRDLKPANIVCFDHRRTKDFVKVLDFGIAKIIDNDEDYQPLTRRIVCRTPAYMSPEQVQGFELDARSTSSAWGSFFIRLLLDVFHFLVIQPLRLRPRSWLTSR